MEKFIAGLALGMIGGALIVANSNRTRSLVKKGQDEMISRVDAYIDEKLENMENAANKQGAGKTKSGEKKSDKE